ncbi:MAG: HDOD domain-containing protein [Deltaproteobacteria bacterium]|nr:HDOD domain-containing protein [Deltaproteobacteria bacterium]
MSVIQNINGEKRKDRMKVICPNCRQLYNIDCEKLPFGRNVTFPCRACKELINIDLRSKPATDGLPVSAQTSKDNRAEGPLQSTPTPENKAKTRALKNAILQDFMGVLPALPQVVLKAQEIMSDPDSSFKELASVIATDQAISVRILKLANSAYYGLSGKVTSIGHASVLLGITILGEIVMMAGTSNMLSKALKGYRVKSEDMWRHSLAVGIASRLIAARKTPELANDAFVAGLIHDSGKIMLDEHVLKKRKYFEEYMKDGQHAFFEAEQRILGFDHSEIGAEVCKGWGIPEILTAAVRYHHYPSMSQDNDLAHIVHMADFLAIQSDMGTDMDGTQCQVEDKTMEFLGLQEKEMRSIMDQVVQAVEKITGQMNNS